MDSKKGLISWFAGNHVAANLLMFVIIGGGIAASLTSNLEIFPDIDNKMITITVQYLGASPEEVETGICLPLEEAVSGLEDIKKVYSTASEGVGWVLVELEDFADTSEMLDEIKKEVDRIRTFPEEAEKPEISEVDQSDHIVTVMVYGNATQKSLRKIGEDVRDDLLDSEKITKCSIKGAPPYEISIEVSEKLLRKYNLTFSEISRVIAESSIDVPGGSIETGSGEILIRTQGQMYVGEEFEDIIVKTNKDGSFLRLSEIGKVIDGFEETPMITRFNGEPAVLVEVGRVGRQDAVDIAAAVNEYVEKNGSSLPAGIKMQTYNDYSVHLRSRLSLLLNNGRNGLILVFICLLISLNIRLSFWTTLGIPISFMGAMIILSFLGVSIDMLSLFAFIICLGIVVDDAIVVGENIHALYQKGVPASKAAVQGAKEMASPVTIAVLTTIVAFLPMMFTIGIMGRILRVIPIVVIAVLAISLVESLLILPAHLDASMKKTGRDRPGRLRNLIDKSYKKFSEGTFKRIIEKIISWRYVTMACGLFVLIITFAVIRAGYVKYTFFPSVDSDTVSVSIEMPVGTPSEKTRKAAAKVEKAGRKTASELNKSERDEKSMLRYITTIVGKSQIVDNSPGPQISDGSASSHLAVVEVELRSAEERSISSKEFVNRWRENVGLIPGLNSIKYNYTMQDAGEAVKIELGNRDFEKLKSSVEIFKKRIAQIPGVKDIKDNFEQGKREIKLSLSREGRDAGLTLADIAIQARQGFYGDEVQRIQRQKDEVRIMLRYPYEKRTTLRDIKNVMIKTPDSRQIPFETAVNIEYGRGYSQINRSNRQRTITVSADVDPLEANSQEINNYIFSTILPNMKRDYPKLTYDVEGEQKSMNESMSSLGNGFIYAFFGIYALIAVQFRSYIQPVIVMSAIPFGIIGAVAGHLLMGFDLSLMSTFGIVALTGIVVNDSLILIDLINRERKNGLSLYQAVIDSAVSRLRPILLTTLTTFFGLVPMILEQSLQAQFLIPMAVSLAFGVLFATCITLILVPSLYMIIEDIYWSIFTAKNARKN
ncbi:efflux RND transporter permease subunit [Sedimentisphaera salicampi]|uniref:efflux RND transporter permease subunit n=1 Tax=Sedimentisphaera salicampi TaxID=1941349 RepID=UPI000B9AF590|nr:efflux RND transporter permease subunit [Sedimentisphaera salicampi]OXU15918.1 Efflux pump membrane transporter BepG [Sedimentisphaera salicampi]